MKKYFKQYEGRRMGWKSNQVQKLSLDYNTFFASVDASQNSVNQSIKKHQSTFENVAMDIGI